MRSSRRRTIAALGAGLAITVAAACGGTVAGTPVPVAGSVTRSAGPPVPISSGGDLQSEPPTTGPSTTPRSGPIPSIDIATIPVTTGPAATPRTRISLSTDPATTPQNPTVDPGPRGVPAETEEYLRKKIGEEAGFSVPVDGVDTRVFTFTVTEIDPDMGKRCDNPSAVATGAALIGVKIKYSIPQAYASMQGGLGFQRKAFIVKGADGTVHQDTVSAASTACLRQGLLPTGDFRAGDSGAGWLVLDSPSRYGLVQYDFSSPGAGQSPIRGWEWVIPGS